MRAAQILAEATELVRGKRLRQHGPAKECHAAIARLWSSYLGQPISSVDVALMLLLVKVARSKSGSLNPDDFRDAAGYAAIAGELAFIEAKM